MRVNQGVGTYYARAAIEEMESRADVSQRSSAGRSPAGLVPDNGKNKGAPPSIIQESKTDPVLGPPAVAPLVNPAGPAQVMARQGVQEIALIAGDLGYFPKTIFVTRDIPVRLFITGASKNTLCLMMDSFQVRKQVKSQKIEEIQFTPDAPGKYRFYCPINGMEGTLVVKELSTPKVEATKPN